MIVVKVLVNEDVWRRVEQEAVKRGTHPGLVVAAAMDCYDAQASENEPA